MVQTPAVGQAVTRGARPPQDARLALVALWVPRLPGVGRTSFPSQGCELRAGPANLPPGSRGEPAASGGGCVSFTAYYATQSSALPPRLQLAMSTVLTQCGGTLCPPSYRGTAPMCCYGLDLPFCPLPGSGTTAHPLAGDKHPLVGRRWLPSPPGHLRFHLAVLKRFLSFSHQPRLTPIILMFNLLLPLLFSLLSGSNRSPGPHPPPQLCWKPQLPTSSIESCIFRGN